LRTDDTVSGFRTLVIADCRLPIADTVSGFRTLRIGEAFLNADEIIALEQEYVLGTYARAPFVLERGQGCWVYDSDGNAYLDCVAGIAVNALGHAHPDLVAALTRQAGALWHVSNLYHTAPQARLAQKLCESSFADRVFFCNSGAEANEGAFKFARKWAADTHGPGKHAIVAFSGAFHGRTFAALAATPREKYQAPFRPLLPGVRIAPFNDLAGTEAVMGDDVCAVIVEPVQGEGGVHPAEPGFVQGLRELCDRHNALLIFDEVQCGLGRTGTLWAHQGYGVTPDLLTAAKPLAGGLPMGAVLMTEAVAAGIHPGDHGSTFAASPLVASVAEVVLDRINDPAFLDDVAAKGAYTMERLEELNSPHILRVRGKGLLIGADLDVPANDIVSAGYKKGLLLVNAGPETLRLVPPLIITRDEIDLLIKRLGAILAGLGSAS
jgi:acetylornithine/N-succinyldiaminopimelate aminotransferase